MDGPLSAKPGEGPVDFIFMLMRNDPTIEDGLDLFQLIPPVARGSDGFAELARLPIEAKESKR